MNNVVVIKCGGSTVARLHDSFFQTISSLANAGSYPIIVHGGGPAIKEVLDIYKVKSEFVHGLRKTTTEVMDVVEMVLGGKVNKWLVRQLLKQGVHAIGVSGIDGRLIEAKAIDKESLGFVGNVEKVNTQMLESLFNENAIPVIAPIGVDKELDRYNINADTAAGAIASAVGAKKLVFVTDVPGILKNKELLPVVSIEEVKTLIEEGTIYGGMIPKVEAAISSLQGEIEEVMIINGEGASMDQYGEMIGTKIVRAKGDK